MSQSAILSESPSVATLASSALHSLRSLLGPWLLALLLSALLVAAGWRWPTPLLEQAWAQADPGLPALLALVLVLVPPALMAALLVARMRRHGDKGESVDCVHGER
ncbi:hypothetical protein [Synechococcus sp. CBW1107]|uniref:hypothetical protein n=1 Tax=Synechococcus sp. CBW1107 TaxID=2789857 RepID=UPI002AD40A78|nr:hypothetical protein [Synechococcus sp. CBW1107]CAK6696844.1 hypothetical protein MNNICLKF_02123 [Synechococcus sp. CBW1107]